MSETFKGDLAAIQEDSFEGICLLCTAKFDGVRGALTHAILDHHVIEYVTKGSISPLGDEKVQN